MLAQAQKQLLQIIGSTTLSDYRYSWNNVVMDSFRADHNGQPKYTLSLNKTAYALYSDASKLHILDTYSTRLAVLAQMNWTTQLQTD